MSSVCFSVTHLEDDTHVEKGCLPHKQTKKMSKMWWKLLFAPLLHSFTLRISVTLSKSSCSWPTLKKKKTLKIASHHEMQGKRVIFLHTAGATGEIPVGAEHEGLEDWERRRNSGEGCKCLMWQIFFTRATVFLPVGAAFIIAPAKFLLQAFSQGSRKCLNNHHKHRWSLLNLTKLALINYDLFFKSMIAFALRKKQNPKQSTC